MFSLNPNTRVFLRPGVTDMRMGFNGLFGMVEQVLGQDPTSGHLFVFCNRSRNRLKVLFWDGSGLWVCAKRLEGGRYSWPQGADASVELSNTQLAMLLNGIELECSHPKNWFRKAV